MVPTTHSALELRAVDATSLIHGGQRRDHYHSLQLSCLYLFNNRQLHALAPIMRTPGLLTLRTLGAGAGYVHRSAL